MTRLAAFAALMLLALTCGASAEQRPLAIGNDTVGVLHANRVGTLVLPKGKPPFPAVILLHGCNGATANMSAWAGRLTAWGYAALILDSFRPRGIENICGRARDFPARERAKDTFAAAAYLRTLPDIDPKRIGLIGLSHGGSTALAASVRNRVAAYDGTPFQAIVAYYPYCPEVSVPLASDVQILIGSADDWTPAERCSIWIGLYAGPADRKPLLKIYPGALHVFDAAAGPRIYFGHHLGNDADAAADSFRMTRQFLDGHMGRAARKD